MIASAKKNTEHPDIFTFKKLKIKKKLLIVPTNFFITYAKSFITLENDKWDWRKVDWGYCKFIALLL